VGRARVLLDAYAQLGTHIERQAEIALNTPPTRDQVDRVRLRYDQRSLVIASLEITRANVDDVCADRRTPLRSRRVKRRRSVRRTFHMKRPV
jgi:hypothetical protein